MDVLQVNCFCILGFLPLEITPTFRRRGGRATCSLDVSLFFSSVKTRSNPELALGPSMQIASKEYFFPAGVPKHCSFYCNPFWALRSRLLSHACAKCLLFLLMDRTGEEFFNFLKAPD